MIAIVDYGVGNLFSLLSSLKCIGQEAIISSDPKEIIAADRIILPGVGAFCDAAEKLRNSGLDQVVIQEAKKGKPLLGICLGMQLLFDKSYEFGVYEGLGLIKGEVIGMQGTIDPSLKIPHIGWNQLIFKKCSPLFKYINNGDYVYFVHSFYANQCAENTIATTEYSIEMTAAVAKGNIYGCQFHPEKSGEAGLNILRGFAELEAI